MGLKNTSSPKVRRLIASMISLALFVQILAGLLYPGVAHAATAVTVNPGETHGWYTVDEAGSGGAIKFVNSRGSMGSGSAQFELTAPNQMQTLSVSNYSATKLSDVASLGYSSYVSGSTSRAPLLRLAIDMDVTDGDVASQGYLLYSPDKNGSVAVDTWQYHNARTGLWWFSDAGVFGSVCSETAPCTLDTMITLYPDMGIANGGGVGFVSTNISDASESNVDGLVFNDDVYNFEAIAAPQLIGPLNDESVEGSLTSAWQSVPGAAGYVYESYGDSAATQVRVSEYTVETTRTETGLSDGTSVWWRVKAIDAQGNEGVWSELWKVTIASEQEQVPTVSGVLGGDIGGKTEELIAQLERLKEPLSLPLDVAATVPSVYSANEEDSDVSYDGVLHNAATDRPLINDETEQATVIAPSENGWKFFGILWYWWVIPLAAAAVFVVRTVRALRETRSFLYSSDQI